MTFKNILMKIFSQKHSFSFQYGAIFNKNVYSFGGSKYMSTKKHASRYYRKNLSLFMNWGFEKEPFVCIIYFCRLFLLEFSLYPSYLTTNSGGSFYI